MVEETTLLKEIWWNGTKEQKVLKELENEENGIVYVDRRIYILNNKKIREKILQEKAWTSKYKIPRATTDDGVNQEELLVARNQERYKELCSRML